MHTDEYVEFEKLFLALADKTRLHLLALLSDGELPVGEMVDQTGESQPKVSRHLAYLRNADVVSARRDGKWIYYGIQEPDDPRLKRVLNVVIESVAMGSDGSPVNDNKKIEYLSEADDADIERPHFTEERSLASESPDEADELDVFLL